MSSDFPFRRRSIRLQGYDYAQDGAYFVTVCVHGGFPLFGNISHGQLIHNDAGEMVDRWWQKIPQKFMNVELDEYVVMPNHMHGIIVIDGPVGANPCIRPNNNNSKGDNVVSPLPHQPLHLVDQVIRQHPAV